MASSSRCKEVPMNQQGLSTYVPTYEYTPGAVQPHISIAPPPIFDDDNLCNKDPISPASHEFQEGDFVCPGFFERVDLDSFVHRFQAQEWNYEMRREAQAILPFLYLGPLACLRDRIYLAKEGFTLLLAIRNKRSAQARLVSGERAAAELGIEADCVDVDNNQELISAFPRAIRRINDHISSPDMGLSEIPHQKKILVFCESGNERSATVMIAYMMVMLNLDVSNALHVVQQRRFCVSIEEPLRQLLAFFESILVAKRDVEKAKRAAIANSNLATPPMQISKKRSFDDRHGDETMKDDDMEMDEDGDLAIDRRPMAPFRDRWA
ncbi:hypothetical protein ASPWEDRAFT_172017 [Aspergillus wentii DTO 134E9]|uniref:Tyrosine specific protein phosphatases domain-containing protein n=1 Tax=Aspergillus wentii DTO 134E9 TaxID=1073089 RepID=A0A1L9RJS2_ASPWE|nr:uncharacterized protein ASPWEDRAFT_172017 [Aspergillus wentii DTO 134E9]KAI9923827.1 hypothetical protein MW887_008309 [Aspergillus wentii]OJJ35189.1 hypothetical protein ASPWEDRAFT_172017 [Aspergillus wentii DTO 134E9]